MCGIFGVITDQEQILGPMLIESGKRLAYRGYDSVGCATVTADGEIDLRKGVGRCFKHRQSIVPALLRNGQVGLGRQHPYRLPGIWVQTRGSLSRVDDQAAGFG